MDNRNKKNQLIIEKKQMSTTPEYRLTNKMLIFLVKNG